MTARPCYVFAGGGTGGHLTPGLAVAAELLKLDPQPRIVFIGSDRPLEKRLVARREGYEHHELPVESSAIIRRHPLRFAWCNWRAFRMAGALIESEMPRALVGLGGFASVPTVVAATRRRIPSLILEQNTIPGRATRFLSRRVAAVCTSFDETAACLPAGSHVVATGNPVRAAIAELCRRTVESAHAGQRTLLILGGSQGAESLNAAVSLVLTAQPQALAGWRIVHQTGAAQHEQLAGVYCAAGCASVVQPFFDDLADRYAAATLVIARAGATTLAELACAGCPAILLPYMHAADNHQLANARVYEAAGAAVVIEHGTDPSQTVQRLKATIAAVAADEARLVKMRQAMRRLARPEAARNVAAVLQSLVVV